MDKNDGGVLREGIHHGAGTPRSLFSEQTTRQKGAAQFPFGSASVRSRARLTPSSVTTTIFEPAIHWTYPWTRNRSSAPAVVDDARTDIRSTAMSNRPFRCLAATRRGVAGRERVAALSASKPFMTRLLARSS